MEEIWKDIDWTTCYEVSNKGRVRNKFTKHILKSKPTPSTLDVYRGNTELEITSANGIPTDTVVIFKRK